MTLTIPANDHGQIRVFSATGPIVQSLTTDLREGVAIAFGSLALNLDYVDLVDIAALEDMTLADLLAHGYDIEPDGADRTALDAITDHAILVMSRATGGVEVTLSPAEGITHITTCGDAAHLSVPEPIPTEAAKGLIPEPPAKVKSDAAIGGRVATIALILMFALVGLMIWIGG